MCEWIIFKGNCEGLKGRAERINGEINIGMEKALLWQPLNITIKADLELSQRTFKSARVCAPHDFD